MEEDVAPRRRRAQRSSTPTKRKRSPHSPPRRESKKEEKDYKKKKERKRSPSSPSSSPSSSSDESGGYSSRESPRRGHRRSHAAWRRSNKLKKFKEGGKSISFLTYNGTFGASDKVLAFIQQFDAAFGDEGFTESSKLCHVAMHFEKSARQWWASLRANGEAPQTRKNLRASIMKQFLSSDAKDKVLTKWQSLKLTPYESIHKYVDKFWDLHLKATVYKKIDFEEQKQQFCAGLPEDMNEYVNSQRPKTISAVIHHTMVAARINFQQGAKRNLKPMEIKEKHEHKGKNQPQNSSKGNSSNNKAKEKGDYKEKNRLTPEELECYRKDNRCMIFVKDSLSDVNKTQVNESGSQEDLELSKFLNQFQDVFIDDIPGELPPKQGDDDHAFDLILGSSPPDKPPYKVSQAQQEEIMRQVNELVEKGMVRPSSSPFCSPILLVHKKDGTYRMCVNYRALNKITIKNKFPMPHIEDLFDKLQGSTYFSRIDLKSGYHQISIVNEDILKTAFCTTFGLYEYLVMPFGLTNAPATFNCMMEWIFRPHRNFTGVFFDDMIIYSKSMEEHKKHLQMQEQLRQACQTVSDKLQRFEGHDISKFCRVYEQAMEDNGIQDWKAVDDFHLVVVLELRARITKLQAHQGAEW
ncbi:hypothetical protein L7F22_041616 [Adiantum nelumboides]|nr:hypothetical protein [Adiantum nelumboides]